MVQQEQREEQLELFVAPNVGPSIASPPFRPFCSQAPQFARDILYTHTPNAHTQTPPATTPWGNVFVIL